MCDTCGTPVCSCESIVVNKGDKGDDGVGIASIAWTSNSGGQPQGTQGTTDTYTVTLTNSVTYTLIVYNGSDGDTGDTGDSVTAVTGSYDAGTGVLTVTPYIEGVAQAPIVTTDLRGADGADGASFTALTGSYNATTGVLTLTPYIDGVAQTPIVTGDLRGAAGAPGADGFIYETTDGNGIPAEGTSDPYSVLARKGDDTGYEFASIAQRQQLNNLMTYYYGY